VFLLKFDDSAGGRWFGELVAFAADATNRGGKDPQRTPFEITTGGNPLASVVLNPGFARAMDPGRASSSAPPSTSPSISTAEGAIHVAMASAAGSMFAAFPKTIASEACEIRGGGPAPGIGVPGTCRTDVVASGSSYIVRFVETWDARLFHLAGEPGSGQLEHTWSFLVDASGGVMLQSDSGHFPPQYVK
jgi:hypothetical protein